MADDAEVCGCNGVCKGAITGGDRRPGPDHPGRRARGHQGLGLLRLLHAAGGAAAEARRWATASDPAGRSRCATAPTLGHDEVRRRIVAEGLKSMPAVMQALEWTTPDGCASAARR